MSNEELLARLDERLMATNEQLGQIHEYTRSIDDKLREVEIDLKGLQGEVSKIKHLETKVDMVVSWKEQIGGSWKATAVISVVLSFIVNGIIQFFNDK